MVNHPIYIYNNGILTNVIFLLIFKCRFPFDWRNHLGYFVAVAIEYINCVILLLIAMCIFSIIFEAFLTVNAVINDLTNFLIEINENGKWAENHLQATEQLIEFVQIHTLLKQLNESFFLILHK